jgi:hypothetical protein
VLDDLSQVEEPPDVVHAQHNAMALAARIRFPSTPLIFHSHGIIPEAEQPPSVDINAQLYIAGSEQIRDHLVAAGIRTEKIRILRNPIDTTRFRNTDPVRARPERALVISGLMNPETLDVIKAACDLMRIHLEILGQTARVFDVERHIN